MMVVRPVQQTLLRCLCSFAFALYYLEYGDRRCMSGTKGIVWRMEE